MLLEKGNATIGELAIATKLPQPTVSHLVVRMTDLGLVGRDRPSRAVTLLHSEETRAVLEAVSKLAARTLERKSQEEQDLRRRLRRTRLNVADESDDASA